MGAIYHNQVIETFCEKIEIFTNILGFKPDISKTKTNMQLNSLGEIDILLYGKNIRGLVEVKSHSGLVNKFKTKQLKVYHNYDPEAAIFLLCGDSNKSLDPNNFHLKQYWPLT
jgi:hypothetical protein